MSPDDALPPPAAPPRRSFREVRWRPFDLLLILAPLIALRVAPLVGGEDWNVGLPRWASYATFVGSLFWMLVLPVAVARWRTGRFPRLPRLRSAVIDGALAIPLLPALWLILIVGLIAWTMIFGQPEGEQNFVDPIARSRDWLTFAVLSVFVVVIGPMSEELIFRGMMYNWLRRRLPILVAAALQALPFALLHHYGILGTAVITVVGFCLALLYEWRRSLVAPMALHALHNAAIMTIVLLQATVFSPQKIGVNGEPDPNGVRVTLVGSGSGAEDAGVQVGDIVVAVDERRVFDIKDVATIAKSKRAGETVMLDVLRDGEPRRFEVVLKRGG